MIYDLTDWKKESEKKNRKKHQLGWFQKNAGNVEYNMSFFNHAMGADGNDSSTSDGIGEDIDQNTIGVTMDNTIELEYNDIDVTEYYGNIDWETGYPQHEAHRTVSWTLFVDKEDVIEDLISIIEEDRPDVPDYLIAELVEEDFDTLLKKYYQEVLEKHRHEAELEASEKYEFDDEYEYEALDNNNDKTSERINIQTELDKLDAETCNKYDLRNIYLSHNFSDEDKRRLSEILKERCTAYDVYTFLTEEVNYDDGDEIVFDDDAYNTSHFEKIASKEVTDSDGFITEYTWYKDLLTGKHVMVFGDSDIYLPEDHYYDAEFDTEEEAKEWFDSYTGFDDEEESEPEFVFEETARLTK